MADTNTTAFLLAAARDAYSSLRRVKGQRPLAVRAFLAAETDEERDMAINEWGAGFTRRGLREAAAFFSSKDDVETANVFYALRDSITDDGFVDFDDESVEEVVAA